LRDEVRGEGKKEREEREGRERRGKEK